MNTEKTVPAKNLELDTLMWHCSDVCERIVAVSRMAMNSIGCDAAIIDFETLHCAFAVIEKMASELDDELCCEIGSSLHVGDAVAN